jgi:hypothetical protein
MLRLRPFEILKLISVISMRKLGLEISGDLPSEVKIYSSLLPE